MKNSSEPSLFLFNRAAVQAFGLRLSRLSLLEEIEKVTLLNQDEPAGFDCLQAAKSDPVTDGVDWCPSKLRCFSNSEICGVIHGPMVLVLVPDWAATIWQFFVVSSVLQQAQDASG